MFGIRELPFPPSVYVHEASTDFCGSVWGGSLAYLNAEGNGGSATSQVLKDVEIPSNVEFAMFSGEKCDESCGYSRVEDVAYSTSPPLHQSPCNRKQQR